MTDSGRSGADSAPRSSRNGSARPIGRERNHSDAQSRRGRHVGTGRGAPRGPRARLETGPGRWRERVVVRRDPARRVRGGLARVRAAPRVVARSAPPTTRAAGASRRGCRARAAGAGSRARGRAAPPRGRRDPRCPTCNVSCRASRKSSEPVRVNPRLRPSNESERGSRPATETRPTLVPRCRRAPAQMILKTSRIARRVVRVAVDRRERLPRPALRAPDHEVVRVRRDRRDRVRPRRLRSRARGRLRRPGRSTTCRRRRRSSTSVIGLSTNASFSAHIHGRPASIHSIVGASRFSSRGGSGAVDRAVRLEDVVAEVAVVVEQERARHDRHRVRAEVAHRQHRLRHRRLLERRAEIGDLTAVRLVLGEHFFDRPRRGARRPALPCRSRCRRSGRASSTGRRRRAGCSPCARSRRGRPNPSQSDGAFHSSSVRLFAIVSVASRSARRPSTPSVLIVPPVGLRSSLPKPRYARTRRG